MKRNINQKPCITHCLAKLPWNVYICVCLPFSNSYYARWSGLIFTVGYCLNINRKK